MQEFEYIKPQSVEQLKSVLYENGGKILAGGTDVIPRMRHKLFPAQSLVDISYLEEMRFIRENGEVIEIGALTTHDEIVHSSLLQAYHPALTAAAATVGSDQTRNLGTLGGNIANASPAADLIPALLVYDAQIKLVSKEGERTLPLNELIKGPGQVDLNKGEFIYSVLFNKLSGAWGAAFCKLGKRNGMAISVANAAAAVVLNDSGEFDDVRLALGSVAPTVIRCSLAEEWMTGKRPTPELIKNGALEAQKSITPISDIRATQEYRNKSAAVLAERALGLAVQEVRKRLA